MRSLVAVFGIVTFIGSVSADTPIFRCVDSQGVTTFSQTACGGNAVALERKQLQAIGEGLRPTEKAWLKVRAEQLREASPSPAKKPPAANKAGANAAASIKRQAYRCQRTRQQLDALSAERRRGYQAGKGIKLRERQQRYETYLDSFCS